MNFDNSMKKRIEELEQENAQLRLQIDMHKMEKENDGWIPCSERMPKINEAVLTCSATGNIEVLWRCEEDGIYEDAYCNKYVPTIVAWQPLPEPYKDDTDATKR